jgi:guanylate kinase
MQIDTEKKTGRLILLSGPSGVGKGPLTKTLFAYMKSLEKNIVKHVLYTDREKRDREVDGETYHFVTSDELQQRKSERFMLFELHKTQNQGTKPQTQGIDFDQLQKELIHNELVFLEIYCKCIPEVIDEVHKVLPGVSVKSVFLTPLSEDDFVALGCEGKRELKKLAVQAVMQTKLTNRNTESPDKVLDRAKSAFEEIEEYTQIQKTIQGEILDNHYGEDVALWQKLQRYVATPEGLKKALKHSKLKCVAKIFVRFLKEIEC